MVRVITALSGLVLVVLAVRLAMAPLFPLDKFVAPAVAAFEAETGTVVKIGGADIELLPTPRVVAADIAIELPDGLGEVHAERLVLVLRPLPLLSGSAELGGVEVERPELRLTLDDGDLRPAKVIGGLVDLAGWAATWNFLATDGGLALSASGTQARFEGLTASALRTGDGDRLTVKATVHGEPLSLTVEAGPAGAARVRVAAPAASLGLDGGLAGGAFAGRLDLMVPNVAALGGPFADGRGSLELDGAVTLSSGRAEMVDASAAAFGGSGRLSAAFDFSTPRASVDLHADFERLPVDSLATLAGLVAHLGLDPIAAASPFDVGIDLKLAQLTFPAGGIQNVHFTAVDRDGRFGALFDGAMDDGTLSGRLDLIPDGGGRRLGASVAAKNVAVGDVAALVGLSSPLAGRLSADFRLSARGRSIDELTATLAVDGAGKFRDGRLASLPLAGGFAVPSLRDLSADLLVTGLDKPARLVGQATAESGGVTLEASATPRRLIDGGAAPVVVQIEGPAFSVGFDGGVDPGMVSASGSLALTSGRLPALAGMAGLPESASLDGRLEAGPGRLTLSNVRLMIGDGAFGGLLDLSTSGKRGRLTGRLSGDTVDVAALSAVLADALSGTARDALGALDADFHIAAGRIAAGPVAAAGGPVDLRLGSKGAEIGLSQLSLGGGSGSATLNITAGDQPAFALKGKLEGARLASLAPLIGAAADGELNLSADVAAKGVARADLMTSVSGTAGFSLSHGILYDLDPVALFGRLARSVQTGFGSDSGRFGFEKLSGRLTLAKGLATGHDIAFAAGGLKLSGSGSLGLVDGRLDVRLEPKLKDYPAFEVPVAITGPLSAPRLYPDFPGLVSDPVVGYARLAVMGGGFSRFLGGGVAPKLDAVGPDAMTSMIDGLADRPKPADPPAVAPPAVVLPAAVPPAVVPPAVVPPAVVPPAVVMPTVVMPTVVPPVPMARPPVQTITPRRERAVARPSVFPGGPLDLGALGRAASVPVPTSAPLNACRPGRDGRCIP